MAKSPMQSAHHIVPTITYIKTLVALAVLMGITIGASYINLPGGIVVNNFVAMLIASIKAFLVMWVFMGLRWATGLARLWAVAGWITFTLMFIIYLDYGTRKYEVVPSWDGRPEPATPRVIDHTKQAGQPDEVDRNFFPRN